MPNTTRVAVLGGGMGALASVADLTDPRRAPSRPLDITVYQIGWRLGGKGASGRSQDPATYGRIEEHGLHNLFGFYDNTFQLMRGAYDELRNRWGVDRGDFMDAVTPESAAVFVEEHAGTSRPWHIHNPTNPLTPGDPGPLPLSSAIATAMEFAALNLRFHDRDLSEAPPAPWLGSVFRGVAEIIATGLEPLLRREAADPEAPWWEGFGALAGRLPRRPTCLTIELARKLAWRALGHRLDEDGPRRAWIAIHFTTAVFLGLTRDRVFERGLEAINHLDFRAWLAPHTVDDGGLLEGSALMRVVYDSSFAYRGGNTRLASNGAAPDGDYEAGTLLAGLFRAAFTYKGAFGWKMRGGTGDVMIAPLYELLRARGVRFRFFSRVDALRASPDGRQIDSIAITEQARVRNGSDYEPLVRFPEGPCWPSHPQWDQLEEGPSSIDWDLEDPTAEPPGARRYRLERNRDFDQVILGISFGALSTIASDLVDRNPRWRAAFEHVRTTRTQALQVWLQKGAAAPGHAGGHRSTNGAPPTSQPITGCWYDEESPLNVWADMSHLLAHEGWTGDEVPGHLSYYVSPLSDDPVDAEAARDSVRAAAKAVLAGAGAQRLRDPRAAPFDYDDLFDRRPEAGAGDARIEAQYYRANTHPSERYVLSVAGSTAYRLLPHDPDGFRNLFLAGDWTRNGMNCGAMESAVIGGRLAAAALTDELDGLPK